MTVELQERPVTVEGQVAKPIQTQGTEPFGDEALLGLVKEDETGETTPSGESTVDGHSVIPTSEGLWSASAQPEAQVANHEETAKPEVVAPAVSETASVADLAANNESVSIDSAFMAENPLAVEQATAMQADRDLQKDVAQTEQSFGIAQEAPARTPEPQMPEFHAQANEELEQGIAKAEDKLDALARHIQERDELRERMAQVEAKIREEKLQRKEALSTELATVVEEKAKSDEEFEKKIQELNGQLAEIEQTLSEA